MADNDSDEVWNVLFLCTHNSARSIIAECVMNRLGQGRFHDFSAGSAPRDEVHPFAVELLTQLNYDVTSLRPKSWKEFSGSDAPHLDFVFMVCDQVALEPCPVWPGQPMTAHWGVPDPSLVQGTDAERRFAFADTHRMMNQRISIFVSLPLASLDKLRLQKELDRIGQTSLALDEPNQ